MNALRTNQLLIIGILLTLLALAAHPYLPKRNLELINNPQFSSFIFSNNDSRGNPLGMWIDQPANRWVCDIPADLDQSTYPTCSFAVWLAGTEAGTEGINFSRYTFLVLDMKYQGSNQRLRISVRNFNKKYSRIEDPNSAKFHSVRVDKTDLQQPAQLRLSEFKPADWWLISFNIAREDSGTDLRNIVSVGVDFEDSMQPGRHEFQVNHFTLHGEWISRDNWYLMIIAPWLIGILIYAVNQLRLLRMQAQVDTHRIYQLAQQNQKLAQQSEEFRRLSTVDPLTQCFNRFGIHQIIEYLLSKRRENNLPEFSLILLDIDYFKRINDRRGHAAGDRVLENISRIIQTATRQQDYVGRWGGEEFIIVLPATHQNFALAMAEKLRILIFDEVFEPDEPLSVTASFGVGEHIMDEDFATTFKRVDDALYAAKNQGRNCCVMLNE